MKNIYVQKTSICLNDGIIRFVIKCSSKYKTNISMEIILNKYKEYIISNI